MNFMEKHSGLVILGLFVLFFILLGSQIYKDFVTASDIYAEEVSRNVLNIEEYPSDIADYLAKKDSEYQVHRCDIRAHYAEIDNVSVFQYWVATATDLPYEFETKANFQRSLFGGVGQFALPLSQEHELTFGDDISYLECYLLTYRWESNPSVISGKVYIPDMEDWYDHTWTIGTLAD